MGEVEERDARVEAGQEEVAEVEIKNRVLIELLS